MRVVDIHGAQAQLDDLIDCACAGEEVVIARAGVPLVRLVPAGIEESRRERGSLKGQVIVPDAFHDPLGDVELDSWDQ